MSESVIVTGGAGFIGSNLVSELNRRGYTDVVVVDNLDDEAKRDNLNALTFAEYIDKSDFRDRVKRRRVPAPDLLFHLGACSSTTETDEAYLQDNNVEYTRDLCEWCLENGSRFVYASSAATYGDGSRGYSDDDSVTPTLEPLNLYGASKQAFDIWALETGAVDRIAGLKYFNVYGPHEDHKGFMRSVVNKAYHQVVETGRLELFRSHRPDYPDGEQDRDFVFVDDAVAVTLFFGANRDVSGIYNCGTGKARTWVDLGRAVFAAMDRDPVIDFIDMPEEIREKYQYHTQADTRKLRAAGFREPFTELEDGVAAYVRGTLAKA